MPELWFRREKPTGTGGGLYRISLASVNCKGQKLSWPGLRGSRPHGYCHNRRSAQSAANTATVRSNSQGRGHTSSTRRPRSRRRPRRALSSPERAQAARSAPAPGGPIAAGRAHPGAAGRPGRLLLHRRIVAGFSRLFHFSHNFYFFLNRENRLGRTEIYTRAAAIANFLIDGDTRFRLLNSAIWAKIHTHITKHTSIIINFELHVFCSHSFSVSKFFSNRLIRSIISLSWLFN